MSDRDSPRPHEAELFQLIVENVNDFAIFALDLDGRVSTWNPGAERMFGWSEEEIIGRDGAILFTPEDRAAGVPTEEMVRAREKGRASAERWHLRRDGSRVFVSGVMSPLLDGHLHGYAKVCRDVTDRLRTEEALRDSEERHRQLADNLPAGFIYQIMDQTGHSRQFTYISGGIEAICGVTPEQIQADARVMYGLIPEEHLPRVRAAEDEALRTRTPFDCQFPIRGRNNVHRWLHCRSAPRDTIDGTVWDGIAIDITERVRTEEALRRSEKRFRKLVDQSPLAIHVVSPSGHLLRVNPAFERLWGVTIDAFEGRSIWDDQQLERLGIADYFRRVFRGEFLSIPPIGYTPDHGEHAGREIWVRAVMFPIRDDRGVVEEVVVLQEDVTEQRRAEQVLERYRLLSEHARDMVLFVHRDGRIADANTAALDGYGWSREELLQMTVFDLRDPATSALVPSQLLQADDRGIRFETRHCRRDGTVFPVEVSSRGADIAGERLLLSIIRDVTERHEAERERLQLAALVETSSDLVGLASMDCRILYFNDAGLKMLGLNNMDEARQHTLFDFVVPEDLPTFQQQVMPALRQTGRWEGEWRYRNIATGATIPVSKKVTIIRDPHTGEPAAFATVSRDITDLKRAEEALRDAARRKDQFLAMLAHELRNPLAPIRNSLHILKLRQGDWETVDRLREMMERQAGHLGRLVDDLLDVSRITLGKVQLQRERLDLGRLLKQAASDHRSAFESRRVSLEVSVPAEPVWMMGDATRLAQIADNLLTNSLKFTGEGGTVWATLTVRGQVAELAVRDTGAGIEPEMLPRLFQTFMQADRTLDRSQGGLGLGLAIVKGLAQLHGGRVRAESAGLGQGSTFTVSLPTLNEPAALTGPPPAHLPASQQLRILVVEDNRDAADSLRMLLETYGYEVRVAHSGPEGVRAAGEHRPQVVICDIGLPGMDGYAVAGALRRDPATASARLIALTGYGQEEDRRRSREAGFDDHLTKPADPAALVALLTRRG